MEESLATTRSRRSGGGRNKEKTALALERLKRVKEGGSKAKYDELVTDEKQVYEEVDEDEYAEIVQRRQEEDWIEDDDGFGYADDGREVFDEYSEDEDDDRNRRRGGGSKKDSKKSKYSIHDDKPPAKKSIATMLAKMNTKKFPSRSAAEQAAEELDEDDILGNILDDIKGGYDTSPLVSGNGIGSSGTTPLSSGARPTKLTRLSNTGSSSAKRPKLFIPHLSPASASVPNYSTTPTSTSGVKRKPGVRPKVEFDADIDYDAIFNVPEPKRSKSGATPQNGHHTFGGDPDRVIGDDFPDSEPAPPQAGPGDERLVKNPIKPSTGGGGWVAPETQAEILNLATPAELDLPSDSDGKSYLQFFWIDAHEDWHKNPGVVYLFGKVLIPGANHFVSCCVAVRNIERKVYLAPRHPTPQPPVKSEIDPITAMEEEFSSVARQLKIKNYQIKSVTRKYAFVHPDVPREGGTFLEITYPSSGPPIPAELSGSLFTRVLNHSQTSLERLILECNLRGPAWVQIRQPEVTSSPVSTCKYEFNVTTNFSDRIMPVSGVRDDLPSTPPFTLVSLAFKTFFNPQSKSKEIIAISVLANQRFHFDKPAKSKDKKMCDVGFDTHFCLICKPSASAGLIYPMDFTEKSLTNQKYVKMVKTKILITQSEREMLNLFMARIAKMDPDILVGHDLHGFDMDLLLSRLTHHKVGTWSRLGRLKRSGFPPSSGKKERGLICGRLICDLKISAKELIRVKSYDLPELVTEVLKKCRGEILFDRQEVVAGAYCPSDGRNPSGLLALIYQLMQDNNYVLDIVYELNALPLAMEITKIAGNLLSRTLLGGRSERNEFLLLHAFHSKKFICPEKVQQTFQRGNNKGSTGGPKMGSAFKGPPAGSGKPDPEPAEEIDLDMQLLEDDFDNPSLSVIAQPAQGPGKGHPGANKKAAYAGGLVLEPKVGFYDRFILLMDFNSLYPSIIQEFNICFTTINIAECGEDQIPEVPDEHRETGILPSEIRKLVDSRREVKLQLCNSKTPEDVKPQLDIRQKALKLTANSMYGCLGFTFSRFCAKPLAALTTLKGREILLHTKQLVEKMGLEVIYGDTDSIMINTHSDDWDQVEKLGRQVKFEVNNRYKLLEIDIDGIFRSMLLLKKKKYAALTCSRKEVTVPGSSGRRPEKRMELVCKKELKGLDVVRRDWSIVAKRAGEQVIDFILNTTDMEQGNAENPTTLVDSIHAYLQKLAGQITANELPLDDYVITKQLTKDPTDYPDKGKGLSHVMVALRYNERPENRRLRSGDSIPYVTCVDGTNEPYTKRAYHIDELKESIELADGRLKIDANYYLAQQIHPIVARLCDPIPGTSSYTLGEMLGVASSSMRSLNEKTTLQNVNTSRETQYDLCKSLYITCPQPLGGCGHVMEIRTLYRKGPDEVKPDPAKSLPSLAGCEKCQFAFASKEVVEWMRVELDLFIDKFHTEYYDTLLVCDDVICGHRTRNIYGRRDTGGRGLVCPECSSGHLKSYKSDAEIYNQLEFFASLLDWKKFEQDKPAQKEEIQIKLRPDFEWCIYIPLKALVDSYLARSGFRRVNLTALFSHGIVKRTLKTFK